MSTDAGAWYPSLSCFFQAFCLQTAVILEPASGGRRIWWRASPPKTGVVKNPSSYSLYSSPDLLERKSDTVLLKEIGVVTAGCS